VALPIELPISTVIMLHSIGDIARAEGEDQSDPETALSCLHVLALGRLKGKADAANSGGILQCVACWPNRLPRWLVLSFIDHFQEIARAHSPSAGWNGAWKDAVRTA
jgi:hypothetical protein